MSLYTLAFWRAAAERAAKTIAQTTAATIFASGVATAWDIDWHFVGGSGLLAGLLSLLTSIGSGVVTGDGPSLGGETVIYDPKYDQGDEA